MLHHDGLEDLHTWRALAASVTAILAILHLSHFANYVRSTAHPIDRNQVFKAVFAVTFVYPSNSHVMNRHIFENLVLLLSLFLELIEVPI